MNSDRPHPDNNERASMSRRALILGTAFGLTAGTLISCTSEDSSNPKEPRNATRLPPESHTRTTLEAKVVLGDKVIASKPYRHLTFDSGQKMVLRQELFSVSSGLKAQSRSLLAFSHITDTHIMDSSSPAHMSLSLLGQEKPTDDIGSTAFRPQDSLTVQVLDAMVRRLNAIGAGPMTGRVFDCCVSTGDASNNRGMNEIIAFIDVLNGATASVFPFPLNTISIQSPILLPPRMSNAVWQPLPPRTGDAKTSWQSVYGYPVVPNLLLNASQPVEAAGTRVKWYSGFGNHDLLSQNGQNRTETITALLYEELATSNKLITGFPNGLTLDSFNAEVQSLKPPDIRDLITKIPGHWVPESMLRKKASKREFIQEHLNRPGIHGPTGHGFTENNLQTNTAYYRFEMSERVTGIMLDTTDPGGGQHAFLDSAQATWLEGELNKLSSLHYDAYGNEVHRDVTDKLVVIFSHHPSESFSVPRSISLGQNGVSTPKDVRELFGRYPNVILWMSGHLHQNTVWPRQSRNGNFGLWEVNTASHIDFPQQSRIMEIADNHNGSISIYGTMVDHSNPTTLDYSASFTNPQLAALSAELAANYPNPATYSRAGRDSDQNVELLLPNPF